jgi:cytochrome c551/c552
MKPLLLVLLAAAPALAADPAAELAAARHCLDCHAIDKYAAAPSFRSIAAKYRNKPEAEARLTALLLKGSDQQAGSRHWGTVRPPKPGVIAAPTPEEAQQLVGWILARQ